MVRTIGGDKELTGGLWSRISYMVDGPRGGGGERGGRHSST